MTRATTLLRSSLVLAVVATGVGLARGNAPASIRIGSFVFSLVLYAGLVLLITKRPRVVAVTVAVLSAIAVALNIYSPTVRQALVAATSIASAGLAVAAYLQLREQD